MKKVGFSKQGTTPVSYESADNSISDTFRACRAQTARGSYVYDILTKFNLGLGHYVTSLNYDLMKRKAINIQYFFYKNIR